MLDLSQLPNDQLEKVISKKLVWLNKIIDFVEEVAIKHGKRLEYEVHSCHTYSKHELKNVCGFSFMVEGSWSDFGGECLKIWYRNPNKKMQPIERCYILSGGVETIFISEFASPKKRGHQPLNVS